MGKGSNQGPAVAQAKRGSDENTSRPRIAVAIATVGRPHVLAETLQRFSKQTRKADAIIVCSPSPSDVERLSEQFPQVACIVGPRGLTHQRNAIIEHAREFDVLVFFDDDFVPAPGYLAAVEEILQKDPAVVMTTGFVIEDGILGPGLSFEDVDAALARDEGPTRDEPAIVDVANGYGCNMSVRTSVLHEHNIRFDENLPLYAWLEDVDFGSQLWKHGRVVKAMATRGIHMGVKSGRQPGRKLGYSQVANPYYLARKGSLGCLRALHSVSRNIAANVIRSFHAETYVDRRGRLVGNMFALGDLLRGRLDPQRVLQL